jgi:capsular polysaccharide biosynthesis protein
MPNKLANLILAFGIGLCVYVWYLIVFKLFAN